MKEQVQALLDETLQPLGVFVSDAKVVIQDGNVKAFEVELDSKDVIDLDCVTKATELINPILDASGLIDDTIDVVDIYGRSKEEVEE